MWVLCWLMVNSVFLINVKCVLYVWCVVLGLWEVMVFIILWCCLVMFFIVLGCVVSMLKFCLILFISMFCMVFIMCNNIILCDVFVIMI